MADMNKLIYIKLELKRKFKLIPQILLGTIALSLVVGAIVFCAGKLLYSGISINEKKTIVFTSEDDSEMTKLIVSTLRQSKSINSVCNIVDSDYDNALEMVKNDDAVCCIIIPKGFMDSLMDGENYPISIHFSSAKSIYSMIISELTRAAQTSLQSAQSGIYVLHDYYKENNALKYEDKANKELNLTYLGKAFAREKFFERHKVYATGSLSTADYYIASGVMLILLLLGCVFILKTKDTDNLISLKLQRNGIGAISQTITHFISTFAILYILFAIGMFLLYAVNSYKSIGLSLSLTNILLNGIFICMCCASVTCCISSILFNKYSSILLHFVLVIVSSFISGAFIPSIILPDIFSTIAEYLPTTYILNIIGTIFTGGLFTGNIIKLLLYTSGFIILGVLSTEFHFILLKSSGKRGEC